jgi:chitodextrinase
MKTFKLIAALTLLFLNQVIYSQFDANSFSARTDLGNMPLRPGTLGVADFNSDGLPEFAIGGEWNRKIEIFANQSTQGNLSFLSQLSFPTDFSDDLKTDGVFNNTLKVVDMNRDGLLDIVMSGYWNGGLINAVAGGNNQPGIINIYLNKGTASAPSFDAVADKSLLANDYDDQNDGNTYIDVADINGDGKLDIATKRTWSAGHTAFLNTTTGDSLSFSAGIPLNGGKSAWKDGIRIIDMDEDGANDIIALSETQVWLAKNTNGTFPASSVKYDVAAPKYMDVADIDNDGDNDYLVVSANNIIAGVNDHTQTDLAAKFPQTFIDNAGTGDLSQLAMGDLDKDGKLDLAVTQTNGNDLDGNLQLYKNTSGPDNVSFTGFAGYPLLRDPGAVRIVDFDGDGKLDIIVHHYLENQDKVSIFLNSLSIPGVASITSGGTGEQVIINGSGLTGASKVIFTGTADNESLAADFVVDSEGKTITLNVPAGARSGKIKIENANGIYFQDAVFKFVRPNPVIDGVAEALWDNIAAQELTHMINYDVTFDGTDLSASFKTYWNDDALYILGQVKDDVMVPPAEAMAGEWNNDYFEVYIDADNSKNVLPEGSSWEVNAYDTNDSQIRFVYATDSVSGGNGWLSNHQSAKDQVEIKQVNDSDNLGYTIEIRIPWTAMGETPVLPSTGIKVGFDIVLADNDGTGRDRMMGWKTFYDQIYQNPAYFGTVQLLEDGSLLSLNDNDKPSVIAGLLASASSNSVTLSWDASTDNVGITAYRVYDSSGKLILSTTSTTVEITKLKFSTLYSFMVLAEDASYNQSLGAGVEITTLADTEAPTTPANFNAVVTGLSVKLTWTASTDNDKVLNYQVFQDGVLIKTTVGLSYTINSLTNNTSYIFTVLASDPSGNVSVIATATAAIATSVGNVNSSEFEVYPNPMTDRLFVKSPSVIASVKIINASGQAVLKQDKNSGSEAELNTSLLPKGLYLLKITSQEGNEYVRKIIKK